jgi:alginate O-acetyltransferase complex protein AlgI
MLFCSKLFLVFFVVVFAAYWALPWRRARVWLLLAASFYFYASWSQWLASVVCVSTLVDYLVARGMDASRGQWQRRALLGLSLAMNVGLLVYFKYANFFLRSLESALAAAGATASLPVLSVILPIGISFYTFEAINYTVDVYRRRIPAEKNLAHFMLFILFFPHLIAGPIVRARDFLPQIERPKRWDWARMNIGVQLFLLGLFKKLAIADRMALYVDPVFATPEQYRTVVLWMATLAWALQVYCDFSGYSDMAIGTAHLLGYKLAKNFDMPYLAPNIAEFWRRWHISLSSWLRDYLFIPLGGSRGTRWQTRRNLLITMSLGGLWHGANWPYVVFGVLQGLLLSGHRAFREFCQRRPSWSSALETAPGTALRVAVTFTIFCLTLVVFRCPTLSAGGTMLGHMFVRHAGAGLPLADIGLWLTVAFVAAGHALGYRQRWQVVMEWLPSPARGLAYASALSLALLLSPDASKAFIYFQF